MSVDAREELPPRFNWRGEDFTTLTKRPSGLAVYLSLFFHASIQVKYSPSQKMNCNASPRRAPSECGWRNAFNYN
jgi:hypothetical protein